MKALISFSYAFSHDFLDWHPNWAPGQPDNAGNSEHCAVVHADSGLWEDQSCFQLFPFVCEATPGIEFWSSFNFGGNRGSNFTHKLDTFRGQLSWMELLYNRNEVTGIMTK